MSVEPFNKLVKLAARAFYDDITTKGDNQPKTGRSDNRGIAVVVLDALTRRQWVREEDLAKDLKLHSKQLRRTLRFFEEEKLVTRDHRRETAKGAKIYSAAVAATADGHPLKEGEEKVKMHTHSYCCLDYAQIYDVVRYRLHRMKKKLKDELDNKNTVQEYICPNCGKRYTALDALRLISMEDEFFHCESCNGELVAESDKLAAQEGGDGDDNARRRRREKLKDMLQNLEVQLKPLIDQLTRVKDLPVPEFGTLHAWEARASAAVRAANGDSGAIDPSKSSQGLGYGGTSLPFVGDTKVEVDFSGTEGKGENIKSETETSSLKVLPPWMIKEGMNLTKEQRGEVKQELRMDGSSAAVEFSDDKKATIENDDKKNIQDEYIKAYYAALLKKQQELDEAAKKEHELSNTHSLNGVSDTTSNRQVGIKSKRDEDEGDDDVEWEEAPVAGSSAKQLTENKEIGIGYIKQIPGLQQHKEYTNVKSLRYGHLMIMTDQDHDGSHIKGLVINFIHSYWPSLLKVLSFLIKFITPIVKATHKNGTQLSFYTMPKYESWKHNHFILVLLVPCLTWGVSCVEMVLV